MFREMKFASALTTKTDWTEAVEELNSQIVQQLGAEKRDLAMLFVHPDYLLELEDFIEAIQNNIGARHLVGCSGAGIIGSDQELEKQPSVSLLVGQLPGCEITTFHISQQELEEASGAAFWHFQLEVMPEQNPQFIVLGDPFTINAVQLVETLNEAYPAAPLIGGLASASNEPGSARIFTGTEIFEGGALGVALSGGVALRTVVAQGCKPIGEPLTITRADKNVIFELGGRPPLAVLQELVPTLPQADQHLARTSLFVGRVINEYQEEFHRGDFLIRNLLQLDPKSGALAVGDWMRTGQTVQFQLRDGHCAEEDLRAMLHHERERLTMPVRGALMFSCLGRGEGLFGVRNHDIRLLQEELGPLPSAGFFCNGEIGPVGGRSFIHGFTSVVGLFCEAT